MPLHVGFHAVAVGASICNSAAYLPEGNVLRIYRRSWGDAASRGASLTQYRAKHSNIPEVIFR
jgi:hypothetical protein